MTSAQPIAPKLLLRCLTILVVGLMFLAGYYYTIYSNEQKKYAKLEDRYVRVRDMLGRDETQRLIDLSRETDNLQKTESW